MHVWRERLHRWFAPLARRCPLSPNAVTLLALTLNLAAAALFWSGRFAPGIALLVVGGLADAFDGIVARVQEKTSRFGDFLDHACDRVSDLALVTGWMFGNHVRPGLLTGVLLAVMLNGYLGTQIEATWRERRYDAMGRGEFVLALVVFPIVSIVLLRGGWDTLRPGGFRIAEWLSLLLLAFALLGIGQRVAIARRLGDDVR